MREIKQTKLIDGSETNFGYYISYYNDSHEEDNLITGYKYEIY